MQLKFAQTLAAHGYHTGVVRARADFGKPHLVTFDKQFHAKQTQAAERIGNGLRHVLCSFQRIFRHRLRLPTFHIIATFLHMANRLAEVSLCFALRIFGAHGKQRDFVIKINLPFHNHHALINAAARGGIIPSGFNFGLVCNA